MTSTVGKMKTADRGTRSAGYTLVELAMVLVILSVVIFVVTPKLGDFFLSQVRLETSARKISSAVKYAHKEAIVTGTWKVLSFDLTEGVCRVDDAPHAVRGGEPPGEDAVGAQEPVQDIQVKLSGDIYIRDVMLGANEKVTSGRVDIEFSPKGYCRKWILHLGNEKEEILTLSFEPLSGLVSIEEGYAGWSVSAGVRGR